jgi:hypothetical protein
VPAFAVLYVFFRTVGCMWCGSRCNNLLQVLEKFPLFQLVEAYLIRRSQTLLFQTSTFKGDDPHHVLGGEGFCLALRRKWMRWTFSQRTRIDSLGRRGSGTAASDPQEAETILLNRAASRRPRPDMFHSAAAPSQDPTVESKGALAFCIRLCHC